MKKIIYHILLLFCILSIVSCDNKIDANKLSLGGVDAYVIDNDKEIELKITKELFQEYDSISGSFGKLSIPLHRAVKGDNYLIYVGLPINSTTEEIKSIVFNIQKKSAKFKSFSKIDDLFIYRSLVEDKSTKRKYLFTLTSKDSGLVANFFKRNYASSKIKFAK